MGAEDNRFVAVLTTGKRMEIDMAVDALGQAGIPHRTQEETVTGMKLAMPVMPTASPGTFFNVLVPAKAVPHARHVLSALPFEITTSPGPWDFGPRPAFKRGFKVYAAIVVVTVLGLLIYQVIRAFLG